MEIFASGDGVFEYSLDGVNFQDESIFKNVKGGDYNVTVRDKYRCGQVSQLIHLINYDRYFTPNDDGYHDTWKIKGISDQVNRLIQIYDRYGKLLFQLDPSGMGWDGTYNGQPMPADDYWFQVTLDDGQVHSGHFSLIRSWGFKFSTEFWEKIRELTPFICYSQLVSDSPPHLTPTLKLLFGIRTISFEWTSE